MVGFLSPDHRAIRQVTGRLENNPIARVGDMPTKTFDGYLRSVQTVVVPNVEGLR
jgi:hypothetical protein